MSAVPSLHRIRRADCQPPVQWYFDAAVFAEEKRRLFASGPNYMGHERMVPNPGDYHTLDWMDHAKVLVRDASGIALLSNVCRHRQSILLEGRGNASSIVCPLHGWTYDLEGKLLGAPHFPEGTCARLAVTPLVNWNGLLFAGPRDARADLAAMPLARDFDFSGYALDRIVTEEHAVNWKTFIEAYVELYHVAPFHPGLGNFADCGDFGIELGEHWSLQVVAAKAGLSRAGTPAYRRWQEACLKQLGGRAPKHGALWFTYYPNVMLEWYPNVLVVSTAIPRSPARTTNVIEFYYPEEIVLFEREFVAAQQAAYLETAREDAELCTRMDRGRRALWEQALEDAGPYQSPMEDALRHFH